MKSSAARKGPETSVESPVDETTDFLIGSEEVAKGAQAYRTYLSSVRQAETRRVAADVLDALAFVFTNGRCAAEEFPWHQVRAHHGEAAFAILREPGTPARVESYLCERDRERRPRRSPESFPGRRVRKTRDVLCRLLLECSSLGYFEHEELERTTELLRPGGNTVARGRMLEDGEFRALVVVCERDKSASGCRDNLILRFGYEGGLRLSEILAAQLDDLTWNQRSGGVALRVRGTRGQKSRSIALSNGALIAVEDWLELRGRETGALLRPIVRNNRVENQRLKGEDIRAVCTRRAEQAGVELFLPQDLRRRVAERTPKRATSQAPNRTLALFGDFEEQETDERIQFLDGGQGLPLRIAANGSVERKHPTR